MSERSAQMTAAVLRTQQLLADLANTFDCFASDQDAAVEKGWIKGRTAVAEAVTKAATWRDAAGILRDNSRIIGEVLVPGALSAAALNIDASNPNAVTAMNYEPPADSALIGENGDIIGEALVPRCLETEATQAILRASRGIGPRLLPPLDDQDHPETRAPRGVC